MHQWQSDEQRMQERRNKKEEEEEEENWIKQVVQVALLSHLTTIGHP